jgi:hypothetical protein
MFPLIAIGAAFVGGFAVKELLDPPQPEKSSTHKASRQDPPPLPQSYLVTPVGGSDQMPAPNQLSALEAVRRLTF